MAFAPCPPPPPALIEILLLKLNALSNDLLHDLVESVLTCCSAAQLHWFRSQVAFFRWCRHLLDCGLGGEEILLRPLDALFFCHF